MMTVMMMMVAMPYRGSLFATDRGRVGRPCRGRGPRQSSGCRRAIRRHGDQLQIRLVPSFSCSSISSSSSHLLWLVVVFVDSVFFATTAV